MGAKVRSGGRFYIPGKDDAAANGWKVETFTAGSAGVLGTDNKATYTDYALGTAHANPIVLDERGEKEVWWAGTYLIKVYDAQDNLIYTMDYFGSGDDPVVDIDSAPLNGSFEVDDNGDGVPNNFTLVEETGGTIAIDGTDSAHGQNCLKFTGTTNGGGTAESDKFSVVAAETRELTFTYKCSEVAALNSIDVKWYNHAGTLLSTSSMYSEGAANPSAFTEKVAGVVVPALAVQATILITGVNSGGTTVSAVTKFDNVKFKRIGTDVIKQTIVASPENRIQVTQGATGVKPKIGSDGEVDTGFILEDSNGNELIVCESVANAVNEITVTNSITAVNPKIKSSGEADTGLIIEDSNGNEIIIAESVSAAVNELTVTNSITTESVKLAPTGTDTNIDLDVAAKGSGAINLAGTSTGPVNVRATPVYGLVILDTPILIVTDTSLTATAQTAVDITAQTTGVAVKAILSVMSDAVGGAGDSEIFVGEGDVSLTITAYRATYLVYASGGTVASDLNQVTVNLADGEIFDYKIDQSGTAPTVRNVKIYLAGYYV